MDITVSDGEQTAQGGRRRKPNASNATKVERAERDAKRTRQFIEDKLLKATEPGSIYATPYVGQELTLVTPFSQRLAEKFVGRTLKGLLDIEIVLRLISNEADKIDILMAAIAQKMKTLVENTNIACDAGQALAKEHKQTDSPKATHPFTGVFKATTPLAFKYLLALQNFDRFAAALYSVWLSGDLPTRDMLSRINEVSGQIALLSIEIMQLSRAIRTKGEETVGADSPLLPAKDDAPLPTIAEVSDSAPPVPPVTTGRTRSAQAVRAA